MAETRVTGVQAGTTVGGTSEAGPVASTQKQKTHATQPGSETFEKSGGGNKPPPTTTPDAPRDEKTASAGGLPGRAVDVAELPLPERRLRQLKAELDQTIVGTAEADPVAAALRRDNHAYTGFDDTAACVSESFGLPYSLVKGVMLIESDLDPDANRGNGKGLMQLTRAPLDAFAIDEMPRQTLERGIEALAPRLDRIAAGDPKRRARLETFVSAVRAIVERASSKKAADKRAAARDLSRLFYSGKLPAGVSGASLGAGLWKDPAVNMVFGCAYLRTLIDTHSSRRPEKTLERVLTRYNGGTVKGYAQSVMRAAVYYAAIAPSPVRSDPIRDLFSS